MSGDLQLILDKLTRIESRLTAHDLVIAHLAAPANKPVLQPVKRTIQGRDAKLRVLRKLTGKQSFSKRDYKQLFTVLNPEKYAHLAWMAQVKGLDTIK